MGRSEAMQGVGIPPIALPPLFLIPNSRSLSRQARITLAMILRILYSTSQWKKALAAAHHGDQLVRVRTVSVRSAQHHMHTHTHTHTPLHPLRRAASFDIDTPLVLTINSATAFPIHRSLELANPSRLLHWRFCFCGFPPHKASQSRRRREKIDRATGLKSRAAATSSLRAAISTRPVWPSLSSLLVLGLFLVCTQADTGVGSKQQDGLNNTREREEREGKERGLGCAPHGNANPSRCYVARKAARQAEQAARHNTKALL